MSILEKDLSNLRDFLDSAKVKNEQPETLRKHPDNDFPDIQEETWDKFVDSIKSLGVRHPVIADFSGRVLSGWQRTRACLKLGQMVPVVRVPNMTKEACRHLVVVMNLSTRQLTREQFDKLWNETYGQRVEKMLVRQQMPAGTVARILAKESGLKFAPVLKRVETARIQFVKNRSDMSGEAVQRLVKKAKKILAEMYTLRNEYFKVRDKLAAHIKLTDATDLPAIQIREDESTLPIPNVVFEKHHGRRMKLP